MKKLTILSSFFFFFFNTQVFANYVINPDHSQILFSVSYLKVSEVRGSMTKFRGFATLDDQGLPSSVEMVINADSITTFDEKRDLHLKKEDFFSVKKYPEIIFKAQGTPKKVDEEIYDYAGEIVFLGKTHPIKLQLVALGEETDPWGKSSTFFRVRAELDRKELGLHWNRVLDQGDYLVGEKVFLDATIQLQPRGAQTSFSTHMIPGPRAGKVAPEQSQAPSVKDQIEQAKRETIVDQNPKAKIVEQSQRKQTEQNEGPTFLEYSQLGFLAFFSLIGIFATGMGVKFWLEKKNQNGKRHFIGEAVFLVLFFFYSTWLYTFTKLLF